MPALTIPPNGATREGTIQFKKKHQAGVHPDKFRDLQGLTVSAIGLGTYLGGYDDPTDLLYEEAVTSAVSGGCNFIDTAVNYRCQRSERAVGRALQSLFNSKALNRSQVVVASKGGFIPFDSKPVPNLKEYIHENWFKPGVVAEGDIVSSCHCLHPAYLQNQIDLSLKNLQLDTLDVYYLHNPETQLPVIGPDAFYERLEKAFTLLEENVTRGKIQYYGLATWTAFREPSGMNEAVSLERAVRIAEKAGGAGHHFKAIQLPYSMAMLEAVSVHGQSFEGKNYPVLPAAGFYGLSAMISAPLLQGQLLNLPPALTKRFPGKGSNAQKALEFVVSTPGVTAAMVGMKQPAHVRENLGALKEAPWDLATLQNVAGLLMKK